MAQETAPWSLGVELDRSVDGDWPVSASTDAMWLPRKSSGDAAQTRVPHSISSEPTRNLQRTPREQQVTTNHILFFLEQLKRVIGLDKKIINSNT